MAGTITSRMPNLLVGTAVTNAGTAVAFNSATSAKARSILVIARAANTGTIFIGGSDVSSSTSKGFTAGQSITWDSFNQPYIIISDCYLDVSGDGEGIDYYGVR